MSLLSIVLIIAQKLHEIKCKVTRIIALIFVQFAN